MVGVVPVGDVAVIVETVLGVGQTPGFVVWSFGSRLACGNCKPQDLTPRRRKQRADAQNAGAGLHTESPSHHQANDHPPLTKNLLPRADQVNHKKPVP
jgi:hypothetical protein